MPKFATCLSKTLQLRILLNWERHHMHASRCARKTMLMMSLTYPWHLLSPEGSIGDSRWISFQSWIQICLRNENTAICKTEGWKPQARSLDGTRTEFFHWFRMTLKRKMKLLGSDHANHGWLQVELFLQNHEKPALRRLGSPNSAFVHSASSFNLPLMRSRFHAQNSWPGFHGPSLLSLKSRINFASRTFPQDQSQGVPRALLKTLSKSLFGRTSWAWQTSVSANKLNSALLPHQSFQFGLPHPRAVLAREDLAQVHAAQLWQKDIVQSFSRSVTFSKSTGTTWVGPTWTSRSIGNHERRSKRKYVIQYLAWRNEGWIPKYFWDGMRSLPLCNLPPVGDERVLNRSDRKATGQYFTSPPQFCQWVNLFPDLKVSSTKKPVLKQRMVSTWSMSRQWRQPNTGYLDNGSKQQISTLDSQQSV